MDDESRAGEAGAHASETRWLRRSGDSIPMRWWDVGCLVAVIVLTIQTVTSSSVSTAPGLVAVGALLLAWLVLVRRVIRRNAGEVRPAGLAAAACLVLIGAGAVAAGPDLATVQAFAMPVLWTVLPTVRAAVVGNAVLCLAVAIGFGIWSGWSADGMTTALVSESLSFVFSIALGLWISSIARAGSERGRLLDELRDAQEALAARNHERGTAAERERLAREIHDTIAQSLTGLVMMTQQTRAALAAGRVDAVRDRLGVIEDAAREALTESRTLVAAGASSGLGTADLETALRRLGDRFARESGIDVEVDVRLDVDVPRDHQVALVRCAQEALANIRKHSGSPRARVSLTTDDGVVRLVVADTGAGFDPTAARAGFGLDGLRERFALVGGRFEVASAPTGTTVSASLPLGAAA